MDVKGYNVFHQKSPPFTEFANCFSFNFNILAVLPVRLTQSLFIGYVVYSLTCVLNPGVKL